MSRQLKPLRVDSFYDGKRRLSIDIMLDRNDKTFFAKVDHTSLTAPSVAELKGKIKTELLNSKPPEWTRVIQLGVTEKDESWRRSRGGHVTTHQAGLEIHFSRKEVATLRGRLIERPFREDVPDAWHEDFDGDALRYSETAYNDEEKHQIPYSAEAWATLNECVTALEKARTRLEVLFNPKDGGRLLAARALGGVALLGDGK